MRNPKNCRTRGGNRRKVVKIPLDATISFGKSFLSERRGKRGAN